MVCAVVVLYGVYCHELLWYVVYHPLLVWCGCSTLGLSGMLSTILVWLVSTVLGLSAMFYTGLVTCAPFLIGLD